MEKLLGIKEKFAYGLGDFGYNLTAQVITLFLMFFLTDIFGINAAAAGTIMLVSKLWDAITDPMMGAIVDRTRSRWGQKRPWLLFGALPYGLSFFLLFSSPGMDEGMKPLFAGFAFVLFCTAQTIINIPYGSLTVSMSDDLEQRSSITTWRMTMALLGTLIAGGLAPVFVNLLGGGREGYRLMTLITGLLAAGFYLVTFAVVRERFGSGKGVKAADAGQPADQADARVSPPALARTGENLKSVLTNPGFVNLAVATLLCITALNIVASMVPYYFTYNLASGGLMNAGLAALLVTAAFLMPVMNILSRKFEKKTAWLISLGVLVLVLLAVWLFGTVNIILTLVLFAIGGLGVASLYFSPWSMVADTIEYSQWKTGIRPEGALYGFFNFVFKVGTALAGFIVGLVLDASGYQPNQVQTPLALGGISLLMGLIPAVLFTGGMIVLLRHPMTRSVHNKLVSEIEAGTSPGQQASSP